MDISSIYANAGYTNNVNKNSSTQKTTNTSKAEQTAELSDAEKLENFKKEIWNEIDSYSWDGRMNISIQITDKAFERMMNDDEFKTKMMNVIRDESIAAHPPGDTSLTWIDENGYKGYSYIDIEAGHSAFASHSKHKDSFYTRKATKKQDYNELYEKERQQKRLQQEKLDNEYWDSVDMKRTLLKREHAAKAYLG